MYDLHFVTIAIIAANVIASLKGFNDMSFFERYKFGIGAIKAGQKDRMWTSGFLHVDMSHLFMNMITLFFLPTWLSLVRPREVLGNLFY